MLVAAWVNYDRAAPVRRPLWFVALRLAPVALCVFRLHDRALDDGSRHRRADGWGRWADGGHAGPRWASAATIAMTASFVGGVSRSRASSWRSNPAESGGIDATNPDIV
jgi:hypothetical protein